ncbi:phage tail protein [Bacillus subtilis]|uniref:phage tail protein n=1 Tax=Pseudochrobactrum asaccharolyticum TaxID=354351 RepID=UPI001F3F34CF|nr:phage tail protein [Pseudochrobactrum asaccharolyticum]MCF7646906.1 phage tail protein [Pseudochrobactrum asaccharolyticum]MCF7673548.1 phage tail protein [Bacillus subtilis]
MSGPVAMALGPYAFEALGFGYQDISRRVNTPWVDIPVAQALNQQQWTGPTSEEVTIRGVLFNEEFGGQDSLNGLIASALAGTPLLYISGDASEGLIHGLFTIQSVDEAGTYYDRFGRAWRNAYSISMKKYGQASAGGSALSSLSGLLW